MVHRRAVAAVIVVLAIAFGTRVSAAQERAGIVTASLGIVTVSHQSAAPVPLKFRDDVFVHDRIATAERSTARILFGGKVLLSVAERSNVTVMETVHTSIINVSGGRVALAVARPLMKAGESIEVRTPNAIAGIRGTVLVVEVGRDAARHAPISRISVLKGIVEVQGLSSTGQPAGPVVRLTRLQAVTIDVAGPEATRSISPTDARRLASTFTLPVAAGTTIKTAATDADVHAAMQAAETVTRSIDDGNVHRAGANRVKANDANHANVSGHDSANAFTGANGALNANGAAPPQAGTSGAAGNAPSVLNASAAAVPPAVFNAGPNSNSSAPAPLGTGGAAGNTPSMLNASTAPIPPVVPPAVFNAGPDSNSAAPAPLGTGGAAGNTPSVLNASTAPIPPVVPPITTRPLLGMSAAGNTPSVLNPLTPSVPAVVPPAVSNAGAGSSNPSGRAGGGSHR